MMVVQSNDLFILGPASHSFAIMPLDQWASVLGLQQLADGYCERSPKLNTVSGCFFEWLLSVLNPFGSCFGTGNKITRFLSCEMHTNIATDEIVNRQKWLDP